jgi:hypothetical protein
MRSCCSRRWSESLLLVIYPALTPGKAWFMSSRTSSSGRPAPCATVL